jgi:large subunit ribosomal protein L28
MARECAICGKKPSTGSKISHAHNVSKRRWLPNLQKIRIELDGRSQRVYVCTRCIKGGVVK